MKSSGRGSPEITPPGVVAPSASRPALSSVDISCGCSVRHLRRVWQRVLRMRRAGKG